MMKKKYRRRIYWRTGLSFGLLFVMFSALWIQEQYTTKMDNIRDIHRQSKEILYDIVSDILKPEKQEARTPEERIEAMQYINDAMRIHTENLFSGSNFHKFAANGKLYSCGLLADKDGRSLAITGDMIVIRELQEAHQHIGLGFYAISVEKYFSPTQKKQLYQEYYAQGNSRSDTESFGEACYPMEIVGFFSTHGQLVPQKITIHFAPNEERTVVFELETPLEQDATPCVIYAQEAEFWFSEQRNPWLHQESEALARKELREFRKREKNKDSETHSIRREDNDEHYRYSFLKLETSSTNRFFINGEQYYLTFGSFSSPLFFATLELLPKLASLFLLFLILFWLTARNFIKTYEKQLALEETRRNLTNAVAHELKTPLGIIRSCSEGLKEKINEEKREHYLDIIINETEYMDKTVMDMLGVSALSAKGIPLQKEVCDFSALVQEESARFEPLLCEKGITLKSDIPPGAMLHCDRTLLTQLVSNFFSNAVRHTPTQGEIRLRIQTEKGLHFSVENSGDPIPKEVLSQIWDVFYKADSARVRAEGSGLGLAICREILEKHGFAYGVKNTETGVAFWFLGEK